MKIFSKTNLQNKRRNSLRIFLILAFSLTLSLGTWVYSHKALADNLVSVLIQFLISPSSLSEAVPVEKGGTGATNAADAKKNLGIRSIVTSTLNNTVYLGGANSANLGNLSITTDGAGKVVFELQASVSISQNGDMICTAKEVGGKAPQKSVMAPQVKFSIFQNNPPVPSNVPNSSPLELWAVDVASTTSFTYAVTCSGFPTDGVIVTGRATFVPK